MGIDIIGLLLVVLLPSLWAVAGAICIIIGGEFEDFMTEYFLPVACIPVLLGIIWTVGTELIKTV